MTPLIAMWCIPTRATKRRAMTLRAERTVATRAVSCTLMRFTAVTIPERGVGTHQCVCMCELLSSVCVCVCVWGVCVCVGGVETFTVHWGRIVYISVCVCVHLGPPMPER